MTDKLSFDGTLFDVPFGSDTVHAVATEQYQGLLDDHDPADILVLTGSPTSMATFQEVLAPECPGAAVPRVTSVIVHATDVINRTDDRSILSDAMRRELVQRFLSEWDWETPYFQRAAHHDSFVDDVAQLLETATWQDAPLDASPELEELAAVQAAYHDWLADHDHLERSQMIGDAIDLLSDPDTEATPPDVEAILVIEFEEFLAKDRQYLKTLLNDQTHEYDLTCLRERQASIRRTWTETGPITDYTSFSTHRTVEDTTLSTRPAATAAYFARDTIPPDPETGTVGVLAADTPGDELARITDVIERHHQDGISYTDMAVACKHSGEAVTETMQTLRQAGIPVTSATVVGFGDDPAIRELLGVVETLAGTTNGQDSQDTPTPRLTTTDSALSETYQTTLREMDSLEAALRRWATESGLKDRVARENAPLVARSQFGNLRQAFAIAGFIEETGFVESTWGTLAAILRRAHEYAPRETQTSAIDQDGVRVDHVRALKNGGFQTVFLRDVTDTTYPGEPMLSRLFPQARVEGMPGYPGVTQVDPGDVEATFDTASTQASRPLTRYHAEHARRLLGIGASLASDNVYLCLHTHAGTALDERVQPSRFLTAAVRELPWLSDATRTTIQSERAAEEYVLERLDRALADIRRANSHNVSVSLDEVEAEFGDIQALLDASDERGDQLRDALQARLDFAAGRVRRD